MEEPNPADIDVGVVGLGLMGSSIVVSLLMAGHRVMAIAPMNQDQHLGPKRIRDYLTLCHQSELLDGAPEHYLAQLTVTPDYARLAECQLVQECVVEKMEIKRDVFSRIAAHVSPRAVIASNTSAIPISTLQTYVPYPERFLGIHWAEPAYMTRFLEVTCGKRTNTAHAAWIMKLATLWGKEPTLLRRDLRGFITNRLMYAVYREMFHLIEMEQATVDDVDKAFRYDAGSWMTLMGIFRRMDLLGIAEYAEMLKRTLPLLSNSDDVPAIMQKIADTQARGIHDGRGLYEYDPEESQRWEEAFARFNKDIYQLSMQYPAPRTKTLATILDP